MGHVQNDIVKDGDFVIYWYEILHHGFVVTQQLHYAHTVRVAIRHALIY